MKQPVSDKTIERLRRILAVIPYVREHPNSRLADVAKVAGCSPRELLEDLNKRVLMCGVPPYLPNDYIDVHIQGDRVSVRFAEHFKRPVRFTMQEALALKWALSSVVDLPAARDFLAKLDAVLSPETRTKVEKFGGRIGFLDHPMAMLQRVEEALQARREVEIEYYTASRDAMTRRTIRPYGTVFHQGHWYVVGHCRLRKKELPFRVDRIKSLTVLESRYAIPRTFDLSRYEREEMYVPSGPGERVVIRFDADIARWVREEIPPERVQEAEGGAILVEFFAVHMEWLIRWVLPFGAHAEVLSPASLRKRMLEVSERILSGYGGGSRRAKDAGQKRKKFV